MPPDLLEQILEAAETGESRDWEFKSARGGFPRSFWESYSAMANSEGGTIILGALEREEGVRLDGLTPDQISGHQKILWDGLHNLDTVNVNLLADRDVQVIQVEGASLLVVQVPRASRTQRPVHLGRNPLGHTFRRRHDGDYRCPDAEVRRMLADADQTPADSRILEHFGLDDLDSSSLTQYRQRFRAAKGEHPWLVFEDTELLQHLGGWRRDRATGQEGLTLAGLLMFGKDQAIRDADAAPHYLVDYRERLDPATRWSDRIHPDGTWEANLFQFYQLVWPRLTTGLPRPFQLADGQRRDETATHEALREAFVNALIHADYFTPGGVVIERHRDRFVMENPGDLLVSLEQYYRGGVSECRNKSLQKMFLMIGLVEQAGSGTAKIRDGWRQNHWRAPRLSRQEQPDRVILELPMVSLIPEETLDALRDRFGVRLSRLSPAEVQALATAHLENEVSNDRLQELLTDHPVDITRLLKGLCQKGLLVSDNRRRWSRYRLGGEQPWPSLLGPEARDSSQSGGGCPQLPADTPHSPEGSPQTRGDSPQYPASSPHSPGDSPQSPSPPDSGVAGSIPPETLQAVEAVANKTRAAKADVRRAILLLCTGRFLTMEDIAAQLRRNPQKLRDRFLSPMVREGLLRLRHPESPTRPGQAYSTPEETP